MPADPLHLQTIVVATDHSACAACAYAPAAEFAAITGADLHVVHVAALWLEERPAKGPTTWDAVARVLPRDLAGRAPSGPIEVEEVMGDDVAQTLLRYAADHDAGLLVMGTHGGGGARRYLLGSVAERVVRHADRPVLVVPCSRVKHDGPVTVPVDFSAGSRAALRLAKEIAARRGVRLEAVHVVELDTAHLPYSMPAYLEARNALLREAAAALHTFVEETPGPAVEVAYRVLRGGTPGHLVAEHAQREGGLLVMSTRGWTALDRLVVGGVTERVLRLGPCPVLILPPDASDAASEAAPGAAAALPVSAPIAEVTP